jgi:hypothetical protein
MFQCSTFEGFCLLTPNTWLNYEYFVYIRQGVKKANVCHI